MLRNTDHSFGLLAKLFHWLSALIVFALLAVGFYMTTLDYSTQKLEIYGLHKSFGTLLLVLVFLRIVWKFINPKPKDIKTHKSWEKTLSGAVHIALYGLLIAMPLSGWAMSSAGDFPNSFFGLFEMPDIAPKDKDLFAQTRQVHTFMAFAIMGIVGLHMAGALKHFFIDRDQTLQRMLWPKLGLLGGVFLTLVFGAFYLTPVTFWGVQLLEKNTQVEEQVSDIQPQDIQEQSPVTSSSVAAWDIVHEESNINFEVIQYGQPFTGSFKTFDGQINFDADNLEESRADITIDIASIDTGSGDRDNQARGGAWFDVSVFPQARFETTSFTALPPNESHANRFQAEADLTIRGVTRPVSMVFSLTFSESGQVADMQAQLTLKRLDFGVGQGEWQATDTIEDDINIDILLKARRQSP